MDLRAIEEAPVSIREHPGALTLHDAAYLATYPEILSAAAQPIPSRAKLLRIACMVYGWMPRALQIDSSRLDAAADDLERVAGAVRYHEVNIRALTDCLHSVVGASKLAHFVNPGVFPIWDRKVEGFRIGKREPSHYHMGKLSNYERYCREILELTAERDFPDFASRMDEALRARLAVLGISAYSVSALRSIDIAIFETVSANAPGLRATIPGKR